MSIGNSSFYPSVIENRIYDLMTDPDYIAGVDLYTSDLEIPVFKLFENSNIEWKYFVSQFPDCSGGSASLSWIENGHLHMIGWDFVYEW